jgi:hypothetical protein
MRDIYSLAPRNKTASLVVDQSGCTSHEGLNEKQIRDNLRARWRYVSSMLTKMGVLEKGYKELVLEQRTIEATLSKYKKIQRDLSEFIIDILKPRFTKHQWQQILNDATELKIAADNKEAQNKV